MQKIIKFYFILIIFLLFISCTNDNKAKICTLGGYISWQQNNWNNATSYFYKAIEENKKDEILNFSNYNLACTYLKQNEENAAAKKLAQIQKTKYKILKSSILYQQGIISFKNKNYKDAANFFKKSIETDSSFIDAKINYELSKKYLNSKNKNYNLQNNKTTDEEIISPAIIKLIKQKEEKKWKKENITNSIKQINDY